jgi:uncharacterized tellurite resistance protein B-like protein
MSLISRLRAAFHDTFAPAEAALDDEEVTVAALLVLVAGIDGRMLGVEEKGLRRLLGSRFGADEATVERLIAHVDSAAGGTDAAAALSDRILHDIPADERPRVLALAYRMAALDGFLHEFEDDLIWRVGRLLGESDAEIARIREDALRNLAPERARSG